MGVDTLLANHYQCSPAVRTILTENQNAKEASMSLRHILVVVLASALITSNVYAADAAAPADITITIKDKAFVPDSINVPADTKVKLIVKNTDTVPAEFESHDLKREKVIAGGKEATIVIGPLKAGTYTFFNEFHEESKGTVIVK